MSICYGINACVTAISSPRSLHFNLICGNPNARESETFEKWSVPRGQALMNETNVFMKQAQGSSFTLSSNGSTARNHLNEKKKKTGGVAASRL